MYWFMTIKTESGAIVNDVWEGGLVERAVTYPNEIVLFAIEIDSADYKLGEENL
jgi:hypothetical protein